ncbi:phenylalanine--tRNA ligase subunit beta [Alicyclobacillus acidiphilus]|uniref:phenylalanine--tRNA ligase subunit beta n=1 Tax=Alicyclobacillus acidiphilus TaxID=182455 RepID=UPI00082FAA9B|nr:phenylalanine--tRNA ligase subunit beta [Alicyclobacillus acidiphilus]
MKVSYMWLSEYVDLDDLSPQALADRLTKAGLAVDGVESRNQGVEGVVVGEVLSVEKHPDAERLNVCAVDAGTGEILQIVCGAPNVRAGIRVPVALVGAKLPGDVKIKRAKLRGVESNGMLCSAAELGLDTRLLPAHQTTGLYILPEGTPIGTDIVSLLQLDDAVLDVDLTPNRSDCLSIRGFAYEVAAILKRPTTFPTTVDSLESDGPSPLTVRLETDGCSRYDAQVLEGIASKPSPLWMQMRLMAMGIRSIDLVVDITNYVMLEWGQPLHAFDADTIADSTIVVRQAREGEVLVTLDGQSRTLTGDMIVIADPDKAIGLAGVMGGENSEISGTTKRVVIESAQFAGRAIRRTGQRLGLRSEAQQRFEKGIDPSAVRNALARATELLVRLAGAQPIGSMVTAHRGDLPATATTSVRFSPDACRVSLGLDISDADMAGILASLGFVVTMHSDDWTVQVPSRRPDVVLQADLVEEVARLYGYDNIPSTHLVLPITPGMRDGRQRLIEQVKDVLVGIGLYEVRSYAFTSPEALRPMGMNESQPPIPLMHPMSDERGVLRTHLLPSLAEIAKHNLAHRVDGGAIFEVGRTYLADALPLTKQPIEREQFALLWFGETGESLREKSRPYDFYDAKGAIERVLAALGVKATFVRLELTWLHPGRSARIVVGDEEIGVIGEIHPAIANDMGVPGGIYAELDVQPLVKHRTMDVTVEPLPKFPGSRRDIALLVQQEVPVGELLETIEMSAASSGILTGVQVFDVYMGQGIPEGHKSVAIALHFQDSERTLTDEEIEDTVQLVVTSAAVAHGAQLRS